MQNKEVQPEYRINFGSSAFSVPGVVADQFLRLANAVQLKVLLCVLRHADAGLSPSQAAVLLGIEEELAEEAFAFWTQVNVFESSKAAPQPSIMTLPQPPEQKPAAPVPATAGVQRSSREIKLDPSEMSDMLEKTPALMDLFSMAEKMIGRLLNHMEQRSLVWLHSYLNIPAGVISLLIGYCVSIEKFSIMYVETIAIDWEQKGINTLELAEEEIERLRQAHTYTGQLCKMFEMKRTPTAKQKEFMEKWRKAGYSIELLHYAYEITVENTEKLNFKYIDSILENWAGEGITTPEQAKEKRQAVSAKKSKGSRRKQEAPLTEREVEEMNAYLSLSKRFKKENDE